MKRLYFSLIVIITFIGFATLAFADPGTTWDQQINGGGRFRKLSHFGGAAVLDKETGRVWEESPDTNTRTWFIALEHCYSRQVGGRKGWRLPTIEELASLVDLSQLNPALPSDHPFSNVQSSSPYWSATTNASNSSNAWYVNFNTGTVASHIVVGNKGNKINSVWCMRGGQGIDGVQ